MSLQYQTIHVPLYGGVELKASDLSIELPRLAWCENASFAKPGVIAKRPGHTSLGNTIVGGGTLGDIRGVATRDDELVAFSGGKVYSYSDAASGWLDRGDYEGVEVTAKSVAQKPTDQTLADRASWSDSGLTKFVVVYAWYDSETSSVHCQLFDEATGATLSADTDLGANSRQPKCLRVDTKLHVYFWDSANADLKVKVIDPTDVAGTIGSAALNVNTSTAAANFVYDVCIAGTSAFVALRSNTGNYAIHTVNSAGTVVLTATPGLPCVVLGVAYEPNNAYYLVVRDVSGVGGSLRAELFETVTVPGAFTAVFAPKILVAVTAADIRQIAVAFRETAQSGSTYRAVIFYSQITVNSREVRATYYGTDNGAGAVTGPSGATSWALHADVGSRAFARGTKVYFTAVTGIFDPPADAIPGDGIQHNYLVYREDGLPIARLSPWTAVRGIGTVGHLPQVQELDNASFNSRYALAGVYRSRVGTRHQDLYADHNLRDTILDFSSPKPYRGVQLGRTLYLPGGYLAQYDGISVTEANFFHVSDRLQGGRAATASSLEAGTRSYRVYPEWRLPSGEVERGSWSDILTVTGVLAGDTITVTIRTSAHTLKRDARADFNWAIYRTEANAPPGAPFYRVSNLDPTDTAGENRYVVNDPTAETVSFLDFMTDVDLVKQELDYQNTGELDNLPPEHCTFLAQGQGRLFFGGHESPDLVTYSKLWYPEGGVAANDALQIIVPREGGDVTAVHALDSGVVIFKQDRIYLVSGTGTENIPGPSGYSEPQLLLSDTGCVGQHTLVQTPVGLMFVGPKGIRRLTPGLSVEDVGGPVEPYARALNFVGAVLVPNSTQVIFVASSGYSLVYDYVAGQWSLWTQPCGIAAATWRSTHPYVYVKSASAVHYSDSTVYKDAGTSYTLAIETPWIKFAGANGYMRVRRGAVNGRYLAAHRLRWRVAYNGDPAWIDDKYWDVEETEYQVRKGLERQKIRRLKVRIEDADLDPPGSGLGNSAEWAGLSFEVGSKPGLARLKSAASI